MIFLGLAPKEGSEGTSAQQAAAQCRDAQELAGTHWDCEAAWKSCQLVYLAVLKACIIIISCSNFHR